MKKYNLLFIVLTLWALSTHASIAKVGAALAYQNGGVYQDVLVTIPASLSGHCNENAGQGEFLSYRTNGSYGNAIKNVIEYICTVKVANQRELLQVGARAASDFSAREIQVLNPTLHRKYAAAGIGFGFEASAASNADSTKKMQAVVEMYGGCEYGEFENPRQCTLAQLKKIVPRLGLVSGPFEATITLRSPDGNTVEQPFPGSSPLPGGG